MLRVQVSVADCGILLGYVTRYTTRGYAAGNEGERGSQTPDSAIGTFRVHEHPY